MRLQRTLPVLAFAVLALCVPVQALAGQTYGDSISGLEYFATSTDGRFAGSATGRSRHVERRYPPYGPLPFLQPDGDDTSGSFSVATLSTHTLVTGTFTGGTVQVLNAGANCTNQTFSVDGVLGKVGSWYSGSGNGAFSATLTHYRRRILVAASRTAPP